MKLLYSDILPLATMEGQQTIIDCFFKEAALSDRIEIATGYISKSSLIELDALIETTGVKNILLIIGMYYVEGMPESSYHTALELNKKWIDKGFGEIRIVRPFKYHGKVYAFYRGDSVHSVIIGSANLGVIKPEASNLRQYEVAAFTDEPSECSETAVLIKNLAQNRCSLNIGDITDMKLIREANASLTGVDTVDQVPAVEVDLLKNRKTQISFILPIKVPSFEERFMDDNKHYTKSNLNVSYAAPRSARKARDWYETQLTVSKSITRLEGYPKKNVPFYAVTDDGYIFKVHTTSDGNKQFSAVGDELILGRWVKGRLAAAGLVTPVNNTKEDTERLGMITKEMLAAYGCDTLVLTKTTQQKTDEDGTLLDIWILSFESASDLSMNED